MNNMVKLAICDAHPVFRYGLSQMLQQETDLEIVTQTSNCLELITAIKNNTTDILIMDISNVCQSSNTCQTTPCRTNKCNDTELLKQTLLEQNIKVIIYTDAITEQVIAKTAALGVRGFLLKRSDYATLRETIQIVRNNGTILNPEFATRLINHMRNDKQQQNLENHLSKREREVLALLVDGASNRTIARKLCIGECTVKFHVSSILAKLNVKNRTEAVSLAISGGISTSLSFTDSVINQ